jgi:DNA-binding response OmpR family regulator
MVQAAPLAQTRPMPRCLLIEDSEFDQRRIERILTRGSPMEVTVAPNLADARRHLMSGPFDIVLLDNALPDGLGIDFAAELRTDARMKDMPILMISDWPTPFMYDKAQAARVGKVLGKDEFQPKHVRDAIRFARVMAMSKR